MNTQTPQFIETEADDFAEETRYAVAHHGKELHPEPREKKSPARESDPSDQPWQID